MSSDGKTVYSFSQSDCKYAPVVKICEITLQEFDRLTMLLNSSRGQTVSEKELIKARESKIADLSSICKDRIIEGFSIMLNDGKNYGFKLTIEDQLNLMSLENQLNSGIETFVYHATNQPCRCFSKADMSKIIAAFK